MRRTVPLVLACLAALPAAAREQQFADLGTCALESGEELRNCRIGFRTVGELADDADNATSSSSRTTAATTSRGARCSAPGA